MRCVRLVCLYISIIIGFFNMAFAVVHSLLKHSLLYKTSTVNQPQLNRYYRTIKMNFQNFWILSFIFHPVGRNHQFKWIFFFFHKIIEFLFKIFKFFIEKKKIKNDSVAALQKCHVWMWMSLNARTGRAMKRKRKKEKKIVDERKQIDGNGMEKGTKPT